MSCWRHSGFHVDRSVRLQGGDRKAIGRLAQYMARCLFSVARLMCITPAGKVLCKGEKDRCQRYPKPASEDLFGGVARTYQLFEPLDFLAKPAQHMPSKGEHLIRFYGCYANKARGNRTRKAAAAAPDPVSGPSEHGDELPVIVPAPRLDRRRRAMLIKRIYEAAPLRCPRRSGTMKIIALIEAR